MKEHNGEVHYSIRDMRIMFILCDPALLHNFVAIEEQYDYLPLGLPHDIVLDVHTRVAKQLGLTGATGRAVAKAINPQGLSNTVITSVLLED